MVISEFREKLHNCIEKYGIISKKTYQASIELDEEIARYYNNTSMGYFYNVSLDGLKKYIEKNHKTPNIKEWNFYANEKNYLSSESMKYIERLTFVNNKDESYSNIVKEK